MNLRRLLPALVVALLVSGLCTYWLSRKFSTVSASTGHHRYVAATQALEAGEILHASALQMVEWPGDLPLTGAFLRPEQVEGRILLYPLAAGQPILEQQLSAVGSGAGLSPKIPEGMRAISLKSDQVVGVAGFLLPGTHVDVLVTYHLGPSNDPLTSTVLQDAQVLTAGQKTQPDPEGKPSTVDVVTLLVSPDDAEKVVLASTQGTVHFVLRNGADHAHVDDRPADLTEFGGAQPKPMAHSQERQAVASVPKTYSVITIRGDKQTVETFQ
jgi:pilus assembly protein CpaB